MKIIITGGAGFIGSNTARYYLNTGNDVILFDNLSRDGSKKNLDWLQTSARKPIFIQGDIRRDAELRKLFPYVKKADAVIHLAAQVAVTTSVANPSEDFEINAYGTFQVLEMVRTAKSNAKVIYSSTNKVYGGMESVGFIENKTRYEYKNLPDGVSEAQLIDFHSPYGCSKGSADQYVHDYSRIYGLDTVVMRQSCIYGPRQFGVEDQGWVAWFMIALLTGKKLRIYGNGKQVRDLLYVDDLVSAYDLAIKHKEKTKGQIYNIGGGTKNTMSVWHEFVPMLESLVGKKIPATFKDIRPGDQPIYVSDIRKAKNEFGWEPKVRIEDGIPKLYQWVTANKNLFD